MCSFLLTNVPHADLEAANRLQRLRGPDLTSVKELSGVSIVHNLLSITGTFAPQPFVCDGIACVYNGEIYNHRKFGEFDSDGKCILPLYDLEGPDFVRALDGEFAIAILDAQAKSLFVSSDVFGTKPIHYSIAGSQFGVASYASALSTLGFKSINRVPPNSYLVIDLQQHRVSKRSSIVDFDLNQHKTSFDHWTDAFALAIGKRTENCREKIFIGLSSGYDSGSIGCELDRQDVDYKSYSILSNEDTDVIEDRVLRRKMESEFEFFYPSEADKLRVLQDLHRNVEAVTGEIKSDRTGLSREWTLHDDGAAVGLALICEKARSEGRRIYLSGQGADEIFCDYGMYGHPIYEQSNFGGIFPKDLSAIFPWASFFGSTQAAYLSKEEYVAGSFGIETRYPFLDKSVVQEFLHLTEALKNARYKSVLRNLLEQSHYPAAFDRKLGFVP